MKKIILRFLFVFFAFVSSSILAGQIDLNLAGISYHIGASSSNPAYQQAPLRLDSNGVFVFNPGVFLGYDFRKNSRDSYWNGFSPLVSMFYINDCDRRPIYGIGGGMRYRYMFNNNLSGDINLILGVGVGETWSTGKRNIVAVPYPNIGINYHFDNNVVLGLTTAFVPKSSKMSATSGFNLLFFTVYISIPT